MSLLYEEWGGRWQGLTDGKMQSCFDYLVVQYLFHWVCFGMGIFTQYKVFKYCDHFRWYILMLLSQILFQLSSIFQLSPSRPVEIQPVICHFSLVHLHSYLGLLPFPHKVGNQLSEAWPFSFSIIWSKKKIPSCGHRCEQREKHKCSISKLYGVLSYLLMPGCYLTYVWTYHFHIIRNCCWTGPTNDFMSLTGCRYGHMVKWFPWLDILSVCSSRPVAVCQMVYSNSLQGRNLLLIPGGLIVIFLLEDLINATLYLYHASGIL